MITSSLHFNCFNIRIFVSVYWLIQIPLLLIFCFSECYSKPPTAAVLQSTPLHLRDHQVDTINSAYKTPRPLLSTASLKSATMRWLNFGTARWKDEHRGYSVGVSTPPWLWRDRHRGYVWTRQRTEKKWKQEYFEVKEVKKFRGLPLLHFSLQCVSAVIMVRMKGDVR